MTGISRRRLLLAAAMVGGASGCAQGRLAAPATAHPSGRAVAAAPGVYWVPGTGGAADPDNLGRIGNMGFCVGERGVVVIDTGTSLAHGRALLAAIAAVTDKPVLMALVTHTKPEFLFGAGAFRERGIPVAMERRCARLMASRCSNCLKALQEQVGEAPMSGTEMYRPDREFDGGHAIDIGGRSLQVLYHGHTSGPGDIAVLDAQRGVLFAGGMLDVRRIPDIQDGDMPRWRRALGELRSSGATVFVPGHGAAAGPAAIDDELQYLDALQARARALVEASVSLLDVADRSDLPAYREWDQYEIIHRRNASVAYLRFERELLFK
ncbi:MAG: MBL fold metallo-hydrolase [Burkholderiales bacterium]|nr:MBL fold metallo-hydrolase [Burkholderiales bacterium]